MTVETKILYLNFVGGAAEATIRFSKPVKKLVFHTSPAYDVVSDPAIAYHMHIYCGSLGGDISFVSTPEVPLSDIKITQGFEIERDIGGSHRFSLMDLDGQNSSLDFACCLVMEIHT